MVISGQFAMCVAVMMFLLFNITFSQFPYCLTLIVLHPRSASAIRALAAAVWPHVAGPKAKNILQTWSASTLRALAAAPWPPVAGPKAQNILQTWSASTICALAAAYWPPVAGPKAKKILQTWSASTSAQCQPSVDGQEYLHAVKQTISP